MLSFSYRPIVAGLLATISMGAYSNAPWANSSRLQLDSVLELSPNRNLENNNAASFVQADKISGNPNGELLLRGDAEIRRGGTVLTGDKITYYHDTDQVKARGNAKISRQGASFAGPSMTFQISSRSGEMIDAQWEFAPKNIRGCARKIFFISGEKTSFRDATITTCKRGEEAWFISINEMEIDEYTKTASGYGAVLHFLDVPILGSPWFSLPVTKDRHSGFLTPKYGVSSSRGVDISIPYYFNIAPNYDYTLTPRLMTKRGVMLGNEARYLLPNLQGELYLDYLPNDRKTDRDRYALRTLHTYQKGALTASIDYNRVSDDDYITDFSGNVRESSESVLAQDYTINYHRPYWNTNLRVTKNQTLILPDFNITRPYERVPQFTFRASNLDYYGFRLRSLVEATRFRHPSLVDGSRFVFHQSVSYPLQGASWFIKPKAQFIGTWYNLDEKTQSLQDMSPNRTLPMFSLDSGFVLERRAPWFNRDAYQTLEPRIFYAWTPYRNQDNLPIFDSTIADLNFTTLLTENMFSGYDRVSEANQVTALLSTRYIDKATGLELFRASIGQRHYFSDQRVTFDTARWFGSDYSSKNVLNNDVKSDLLASVGALLTKDITASASAQYSSAQNRFVKLNSGIRWQPKPMSLMGLYYRYNYSPEDYYNHIKQIDFAVQWPITDRLYGLFRYNYSLYGKKAIEAIAGLEYYHDCWTIRTVAQRYTTSSNKEETNFFIQLELLGLGSVGTNPLSELQRNIKGYQTRSVSPSITAPYDYYE